MLNPDSEHSMATHLTSSSPLRFVVVLAATASLLVTALLVSRATAPHQPELRPRTNLSTSDAQTSVFVSSGGLVPDSPPSEPDATKNVGSPAESR
jgi:hypothetical protein